MKPRTFEIPKNSKAAYQIRQSSGWMEMGLQKLETLRSFPMPAEAHKLISDVTIDIQKAQRWLDETGVPDTQLPLIENVRFEPARQL